ncbi:MAG: PQQ-dependent dehydrogenase, methanol/ethanol family [Pseudomonadota bacterium]|nr:PQQ-dependent dehydrogenase, methanol/ethanol family [Pseudomonadota bacterium]
MQKPQFLSLPLLPWTSVFLIALLVACSPDSPETSETPDMSETLASQEGATLDPNDVAEALVVSTTHWLNEAPIGDGMGAVTTELLSQPHSANPELWLQYGGDYSNNRHSPITDLSPANVDQLQFAWGFPTGTLGQFAASPVVYDGIMYVTSSYNRLFALDAATGQLYWRYDHPQPEDLRICCGPANRGVAIVDDKVLMATLDARLLAFDRKSGEILWNTEIIDYARGFSATSAPLIVKDMAIIGIAGGEYGVRGFFDAYNVNTGELAWRHYTVPAEGEPGFESWSGNSYETGGAPAWTIGTYDPELNLLYWTTGNPAPDWNGDARLGDNLFSDSVLALNPDTGEQQWYYQFTPHDVWDYDGNSHLFQTDLEVNGETVKALVQANRNGFFYAINRENGQFIRATNYMEQLNWATAMEESGRPVVNPEALPTEEPTYRVCPGALGGMNGAVSGSLNPDLSLAFIPVIESCQMMQKGISIHFEGQFFTGGLPIPVDPADGTAYGHVTAMDYQTGEVRWRFMDPQPMMAGTLSTAGGLVFTGSQTGHAFALDAETGEELWRFRLGGGIRSQPIAYQVGGEAYVAIGSSNFQGIAAFAGGDVSIPEGGHLYVFKLRN